MSGVSKRFKSLRVKGKRDNDRIPLKVTPTSHSAVASDTTTSDPTSQDSSYRPRFRDIFSWAVYTASTSYQRMRGRRASVLGGEDETTFWEWASATFEGQTTNLHYLQSGQNAKRYSDLLEIFTPEDPKPKLDKDQEKKIQAVIKNLRLAGISLLKEPQAQYALQTKAASWDVEKATELCMIFEDSIEGILREHKATTTLLGAENREKVTCYLDALLFAMFAKLDSFEAILFDHFEDGSRRRLAGLLRLWVNMLRSGMLITTDITAHIQSTLAACGWDEAKLVRQQDASEAFTFITDVLNLPLLTLKMDIFHQGKEEESDDHKFINERLLEVAIPDPPEDGSPITLESCLETYFNNRIEVKRHLQRRATLQSGGMQSSMDKSGVIHIESVELSGPETPLSTSSTAEFPSPRPLTGRIRQDSIFSERRVNPKTFKSSSGQNSPLPVPDQKRQNSGLKKEVLMPAWQFFSLIPWYTDNAPKNDLQVAAHFASQRPILGICLKRYTMEPNGQPVKLTTPIDIPLEIGLPHFISDDQMDEEGPIYGNFKLSLQSVICHRGTTVNSGHYISLVRCNDADIPQIHADDETQENKTDLEVGNTWLQFDDLASPRVRPIDIAQAIQDESPYLLFYQVQPIDDSSVGSDGAPPPLSEQGSLHTRSVPSVDNLQIPQPGSPRLRHVSSSQPRPISLDLSSLSTSLRQGRASMSSNHESSSITFDDRSSQPSRHATAPSTPVEEHKSRSGLSSRRGSHESKRSKSRSRPTSRDTSRENRLSFTLSRMTGRSNKEGNTASSNGDESAVDGPEVTVEKRSATTGGLGRSKSNRGKKSKKTKTNALERECSVM